ncbi:hypothetical protein ACFLXQ_04725 [Chloroflexota bacterium]
MPCHNEIRSTWADDLNIRAITKGLVNRIMFDLPLAPPHLVDFGVDTPDHYRALRAVLINDGALTVESSQNKVLRELNKRIVELDQAYGNGSKLMALVKKYAPEYADLLFRTSWDEIRSAQQALQQGR